VVVKEGDPVDGMRRENEIGWGVYIDFMEAVN
jgi:hypothetical protein